MAARFTDMGLGGCVGDIGEESGESGVICFMCRDSVVVFDVADKRWE